MNSRLFAGLKIVSLVIAFGAILMAYNNCSGLGQAKGKSYLNSISDIDTLLPPLTISKSDHIFISNFEPLRLGDFLVDGEPPFEYSILQGQAFVEPSDGNFQSDGDGPMVVRVRDHQGRSGLFNVRVYRHRNALMFAPRQSKYFLNGAERAGPPIPQAGLGYTDTTVVTGQGGYPSITTDPLRLSWSESQCEDPALTPSSNCDRQFLGALLEGEMENLFQRSVISFGNPHSSFHFLKAGESTPYNATSPISGVNTGQYSFSIRYYNTTSSPWRSNLGPFLRARLGKNLSVGSRYTLSFYARHGGYSPFSNQLQVTVGNPIDNQVFNLDLTSSDNVWKRYSFTFTNSTPANGPLELNAATPSDNFANLVEFSLSAPTPVAGSNATLGLHLFGFQLEQSDFATSYIHASQGATTIRPRDVFRWYSDNVQTPDPDFVNPNEGTVVLQFTALRSGIRSNQTLFTAVDIGFFGRESSFYLLHALGAPSGVTDNKIAFEIENRDAEMVAAGDYSQYLQTQLDQPSGFDLSPGQQQRAVVGFKENAVVVFINGQELGRDTSALLPKLNGDSGLKDGVYLQIGGSLRGSGSRYGLFWITNPPGTSAGTTVYPNTGDFYGYVKTFRHFNTRFSDDLLKALSEKMD